MLDINDHVKLSTIHLKQFMSFKEIELTDLEKYKIIFIMSTNATGKSTITSEALYYGIFGSALRFKKNIGLLNRSYVNGDAFAKVSLAISSTQHMGYKYIDIQRNLQAEPKFVVETQNDDTKVFEDLLEIRGIPQLNSTIKSLLDIDEKKFSILYLKSPFSGSLFESKSTLLASITKVNFFNDLRTDFNGIVKDLKKTLELKVQHLDSQRNLLESTKKQLEQFRLNKESSDSDVQLLEELRVGLQNNQKEIQNEIRRKNIAISNREKRQNELNKYQSMKAQVETQLSHKTSNWKRLQKLIDAGKCPTCAQTINEGLYDTELDAIKSEGVTLREQLVKINEKLTEVQGALGKIISFVDESYNNEQGINNNIIGLTNQIAQLETKLKNNSEKQKSDDAVLDKINKSITEIHDDITSLERDYNVMNKIFTKLLNKKGDYINRFYNQKIATFTGIYTKLLIQMTNGKYDEVKIDMNNYPTFNGNITYESLSTSERKFVDIAFVIAYISYLSTELKFKTFILDEFFDNFDQQNVLHIYDIIYKMADDYNLQIFITSNLADYIMGNMEQYVMTHPDVKLVNLRQEIGLDDEVKETVFDDDE